MRGLYFGVVSILICASTLLSAQEWVAEELPMNVIEDLNLLDWKQNFILGEHEYETHPPNGPMPDVNLTWRPKRSSKFEKYVAYNIPDSINDNKFNGKYETLKPISFTDCIKKRYKMQKRIIGKKAQQAE